MLKNYLLVTLRNLYRSKVYSFINIFGFALGLAASLVVALYVLDDLTYDRMHKNGDRIYRLLTEDTGSNQTYAVTSGALTKSIMLDLPEVEATTRVFNYGQIDLSVLGIESEQGIQRRVLGSDSNFFKVFDFELIAGDRNSLLKSPNSLVISDEVAKAMFGDEPALGQTVQSPGEDGPGIIEGVFRSLPTNSHLQFDVVAPAYANDGNRIWWESWDNVAGWGYLRAVNGHDPELLWQKVIEVARDHGFAKLYTPRLQNLYDIHLGSSDLVFDHLNANKNDSTRIVLLSVIAVMTLLLAAINFINLSSARAMKRAREVGMRKVVGADRRQLIGQFLGESVLLTLFALLLAGITVQLLLPILGNFLGKPLAYSVISHPPLTAILVLSTIVIGLVAGIYPALVLSGFKPVVVLKGAFRSTTQGIAFRRALVVFQFAISIALISSVILVRQQLHHVVNMDLGYNIQQTYAVFTFNREVAQHREALMDRFSQIPGVIAVGSSNYFPGNTPIRYDILPEGVTDPELSTTFDRIQIGPNFIAAYDVEVLAGRGYSKEFADSATGIIINQAGATALGLEGNAVGQTIYLGNIEGGHDPRTVIGVVKDFHLQSAHSRVSPLVLELTPAGGGVIGIRIAEGRIQPVLEEINATWSEILPERPMNGVFVDQAFNQQYNDDRNFSQKVEVFTLFALVIATLGLLGLTAYSTEQRQREIAVRKVLGSGEGKIIALLTSDIVKWVLIANLFAWPLAWFSMKFWLQTFVYHIDIGFGPFLLAGAAALAIAFLTVAGLAIRAARRNPATILRTE